MGVHACATMPNGGLAAASVTVLDGKAYVFAGRDKDGVYQNQLWQYDPIADSWTSLGTCPGKQRVNATMASVDDLLYLGLGYAATRAYNDSAYLCDWWSYNPANGQWNRLADFPNRNTVAAKSFSVDGKIYTMYGFGYGFTRTICVYSPEEDKWTQWSEQSYSATGCFGACGALCGGLLYFGLGYDTHNLTQWYEVALPSDSWTKRRSIPGKGRELSACAASDRYVYVFGGRHFGGDRTGGEVFDTFLRYVPETDQWEWCGTMPCGRAENQVAFTINGKVFFGLGENVDKQVISQLYCIE